MIVIEKEVVVNNANGVHGRVATKLALIARHKAIELRLLHNSREIDCTSVLEVLSLAFIRGSRFQVRISGEEEEVQAALKAVEEIFAEDRDL